MVQITAEGGRIAGLTAARRERMAFRSGADDCAAWHYRGSNGACVVMAGGAGVTKEPATDRFAARADSLFPAPKICEICGLNLCRDFGTIRR